MAFLLSPAEFDGLLGEAGPVGGVIMQSSEEEEDKVSTLLLYSVGFGVGHQPEGLPFGSRVGRGSGARPGRSQYAGEKLQWQWAVVEPRTRFRQLKEESACCSAV